MGQLGRLRLGVPLRQMRPRTLTGELILGLKRWIIAALSMLAAVATIGLAGIGGANIATANQCAAQCYAQERACMQQTKGSPSCSAQLTSCLQSCRGN